ncbi:hypothetical protein ABW20_dc0101124 [Dactylellina cionopaga]|nr:hypothetical protein ABW20_dc0101124 [Dactylellina cionopaga]
MARPKKDTTMQDPTVLLAGEFEAAVDNTPSGEHKRSARAPTVPFQMVTRRRGAQARTSGGPEEHAAASDDLISAREEDTEAASVPTVTGPPDSDPSTIGEGSGGALAAEPEAEETPRRSSRVVPKKVAPTKPSLIVKLPIRPEALRRLVEIWSEEPEPPKPAAVEDSAPPVTPVPLAVTTFQPEEAPIATPAETPVRGKRTRKPKDFSYNDDAEGQESPNQEEERPVKRRRKTNKAAGSTNGEDTEMTLTVSEPVANTALPSSNTTPLPTNQADSPTSGRPAQADAPEQQASVEAPRPEVPTPEEPPQKRRGRPPKAELLRRQQLREAEQPQILALPRPSRLPPPAPVIPIPAPVNELANQFRAAIPQGLGVLDVINLAKHMRDKNLQAKKRPIKRCIKRGFRVEHRVTREWCTQRNQRLVGQQRKLDRHLRRANLGLLDQTVNLVQNSPDYLSETGPAAPFYKEGLRVADEVRQRLLDIAAYKLELDIKLAHTNLERGEHLARRRYATGIEDALDKLAEQGACLKRVLKAFVEEFPKATDAIIEQCEANGEGATIELIEAACDLPMVDIDAELDAIWRGRGGGLGVELRFADYIKPDVHMKGEDDDEEVPVVIMSNERGGLAEDRESEEPQELQEPQEPQEQHGDLEALMAALKENIQASKEQALKEKASKEQAVPADRLDIFATLAAQQERLLDLSERSERSEKPSEKPSPMPEMPSPAMSGSDRIILPSASPAPSYFGGDGSTDGRSSTRIIEESAEPGFALSGPAPPPDVLKPSSLYQEQPESRSRFTGSGESRRWTEARIFQGLERPHHFSPLQTTHHHYLPGVSPPPLLSAGSSVHSLPPPSAMSSPGRLLPSPVPTTRFPAAYQAVGQRSPSPGFFNSMPHDPRPHDPRFRGEQGR